MLGILGERGRSFDWINFVFCDWKGESGRYIIVPGRRIWFITCRIFSFIDNLSNLLKSASSIVRYSSNYFIEHLSRKKRGDQFSLSPAIFLRRRRNAKKLKEIPSLALVNGNANAFHSLIPDSYSVGLFDPRDLDLRAIEPAPVEASLNFSIPLVDRERKKERVGLGANME